MGQVSGVGSQPSTSTVVPQTVTNTQDALSKAIAAFNSAVKEKGGGSRGFITATPTGELVSINSPLIGQGTVKPEEAAAYIDRMRTKYVEPVAPEKIQQFAPPDAAPSAPAPEVKRTTRSSETQITAPAVITTADIGRPAVSAATAQVKTAPKSETKAPVSEQENMEKEIDEEILPQLRATMERNGHKGWTITRNGRTFTATKEGMEPIQRTIESYSPDEVEKKVTYYLGDSLRKRMESADFDKNEAEARRTNEEQAAKEESRLASTESRISMTKSGWLDGRRVDLYVSDSEGDKDIPVLVESAGQSSPVVMLKTYSGTKSFSMTVDLQDGIVTEMNREKLEPGSYVRLNADSLNFLTKIAEEKGFVGKDFARTRTR